MDQEKPFKTIEVVDSKTNQVCKVACMSCIRGHRTTSCGIPVCRSKIFWTVKRPGRPSNSCTCRYGATGGCKCVVARSACPHKSRKGEKRSGECRCDEQGRYCCLLEPDHWAALLALMKPVVEFFPSREILETKQTATIAMQHFSPTSSYTVASPPGTVSVPNTPRTNAQSSAPSMMPSPYAGFSPHSSSLTPRFGLMGIGTLQGSQHGASLDPLIWDSNVPVAPREFLAQYGEPMSPQSSCCQTSAPPARRAASSTSATSQPFMGHDPLHELSLPQPYHAPNGIHENHSTVAPSIVPPASTSTYNFERLQADYQYYQFPSAICQNCGLSGCTCKNCPPPFQNPGTGSWAQCCGRKHARDPAPTPVPHKVPRSLEYDGTRGIHQHAQEQQSGGGCCSGPAAIEPNNDSGLSPYHLDPTYMDALDGIPSTVFDEFQLDHSFMIPESTTSLNMADYVHVDEDTAAPPVSSGEESGGCCCKG